jgi:hypothetical protein
MGAGKFALIDRDRPILLEKPVHGLINGTLRRCR